MAVPGRRSSGRSKSTGDEPAQMGEGGGARRPRKRCCRAPAAGSQPDRKAQEGRDVHHGYAMPNHGQHPEIGAREQQQIGSQEPRHATAGPDQRQMRGGGQAGLGERGGGTRDEEQEDEARRAERHLKASRPNSHR